MDFNVKDYYASGFSGIPNDPAAIRAAAEAILAEGWYPGNSSPRDWATMALRKLDYADQKIASGNNVSEREQQQTADAYADAYRWITGNAQPTMKKHVLDVYERNKAETLNKLQNEYANIANLTDFSNPNLSEQEKATLQARADAYLKDLAPLLKDAENFGIDPGDYGLTRTESGYIPTSQATQSQGRTNHSSEAMSARQGADGTWEIVGSNTGKVYQSGLPDASAAEKQINLMVTGGTADAAGAFGGSAQGGTYLDGAAFQRLVGLGLTEADIIRDGEKIYLRPGVTEQTISARKTSAGGAGSGSAADTVLSNLESTVTSKESEFKAANPGTQVTEAMRSAWLAEAYDELKGNKYNAEILRNAEFDLGQSLSRFIEDARVSETNTLNKYREDLGTTQSSLQDRGFTYGGIRTKEEQALADKANADLAATDLTLTRNLQDATKTNERYFGSDYSSRIAGNMPSTTHVGRVIAGTPDFQSGSRLDAFAPAGGQYGSYTRDLEEEARTRAQEKEGAFRDITSQYA